MGLLDGNGQELATRLDGEAERESRHARAAGDRAGKPFRVRRCRQPAGAVAAARLLGAGEARRACRRNGCGSWPRMTPIRSCAGNRASNSPPRCCSIWSPRSSAAIRSTVDPALIEAAWRGAGRRSRPLRPRRWPCPARAYAGRQDGGRRCRRDPCRARIARAPPSDRRWAAAARGL